jgi:hypothetical protein
MTSNSNFPSATRRLKRGLPCLGRNAAAFSRLKLHVDVVALQDNDERLNRFDGG